MRLFVDTPSGTLELDQKFLEKDPTHFSFFSFGVKNPYCYGEVFREKGSRYVFVCFQGKADPVESLEDLVEVHWITKLYGARIEAS